MKKIIEWNNMKKKISHTINLIRLWNQHYKTHKYENQLLRKNNNIFKAIINRKEKKEEEEQ